MTFISQVNMTIINTLPMSKGLFTRFMDNNGAAGTKSLLDYGLIDNDHVNTVTRFVIDEDARYSCGSDHALLECILDIGSRPSIHWSYSEAVHYKSMTAPTTTSTWTPWIQPYLPLPMLC